MVGKKGNEDLERNKKSIIPLADIVPGYCELCESAKNDKNSNS